MNSGEPQLTFSQEFPLLLWRVCPTVTPPDTPSALLSNKSGSHAFTGATTRSAVVRAGWPLAVPSAGLTKMGRAETEKISQDAGILFFQRKEFFARSQAAFHFHGTSLPYSPDRFKAEHKHKRVLVVAYYRCLSDRRSRFAKEPAALKFNCLAECSGRSCRMG